MAYYLTKKGLQDLEEELKKIVDIDLPKALEEINTARSEGDLRENAGYQSAIKVKDELTARQQEIEEVLKSYEIIEEDNSSTKVRKTTVQIGVTVKIIYTESKLEYTAQIVGTSESNMLNNKISNESPLAIAIMNKKVGDKATFKTPSGRLEVKILEIS